MKGRANRVAEAVERLFVGYSSLTILRDKVYVALIEEGNNSLKDAASVIEGPYLEGVVDKADKCPHDRYGWEGCDACAVNGIYDLIIPTGRASAVQLIKEDGR